MYNMKLHTICTLTVSSILTIGLNAAAQLTPDMEASATCEADCFRGNSQAHDGLGGLQKIPKFQNVNLYEDNMGSSVDRNVETQFSAIGELEANAVTKDKNGKDVRSYGSAVMISPCYIMTNHHVAFGDDPTPLPGKDYSMKFRVGATPNAAFIGNTEATPVKWGNLGMCGANDWAIMKLKSCVGARADIGWMEGSKMTARDLVAQSADVAVGGYAADHKRGDLSIGVGKVKGFDKPANMLKYSAPMAHGMSGGAVIVMEDGILKLAGINAVGKHNGAVKEQTVYSKYSDENANEFLSANEVLNRADIKEMLDEDKAAVGPNPALGRFARPLPSAAAAASI